MIDDKTMKQRLERFWPRIGLNCVDSRKGAEGDAKRSNVYGQHGILGYAGVTLFRRVPSKAKLQGGFAPVLATH